MIASVRMVPPEASACAITLRSDPFGPEPAPSSALVTRKVAGATRSSSRSSAEPGAPPRNALRRQRNSVEPARLRRLPSVLHTSILGGCCDERQRVGRFAAQGAATHSLSE